MKDHRKNPMITARSMGDGMFLIPVSDDINKIRKIYRLNELGWFIWHNIDGAEDMDNLSLIISREFEVEKSLALKDARRFINDLIQAGAIIKE